MNCLLLKKSVFVMTLLIMSYGSAQDAVLNEWRMSYDTGLTYMTSKNWEKAAFYLNTSYKIATEVFANSDARLDSTAFHYGVALQKLGSYAQAIELLQISTEIRKINHGTYSKAYERNLVKLGDLYTADKQYKEANLKYIDVLNILTHNGKKASKDYIVIQRRLAHNFSQLGDYETAIECLNDGLEIIRKARGSNNTDYFQNQLLIAVNYFKTSDYEQSEDLLKEVKAHLDLTNTKDRRFHALLFHELAKAQLKQGSYKEAFKHFNAALSRLENSSTAYYSVSTDLALAYENLGDDEKAIEIYSDLYEASPKNSPDYLNVLQGLALIYTKLGDYQRAQTFYEEALTNLSTEFKNNYPLEASKVLNNAGKLYYQLQDYERAKAYYKEALDLFMVVHDDQHFDYGYLNADYAYALFALGDQEKAIDRLETNLKIDEVNNRLQTESYANKQYQLAVLYSRSNQAHKAIPLLESASKTLKAILGNQHSDYGYTLVELCKAYEEIDAIQKTVPLIKEANSLFISQLRYNFNFRTENEKKLFIDKLITTFDTFQSIGLKANNNWPELNVINLNNQLVLKGLLLTNSVNIIAELESLNTANVDQQLMAYNLEKSRLNEALLKSNGHIDKAIAQLQQNVNTLEIELVKQHASTFGNTAIFQKDWIAIKNHLKKDAVALEFSTIKTNTGSSQYAVYTFKRTSHAPDLIPLFKEDQLAKALENKTPNILYNTRGSKGTAVANSKVLYNLIWKPIQSYLSDTQTIYYAPSGLLYQVAFAALVNNEKSVLCSSYNLVQLTSTSLITSSIAEPTIKTPLLVGGVDYNYGKANDYPEKWPYLDGTLKETESIASLLESNGIQVTKLTTSEATERQFKTITYDHSIIHLATHGFFFEKDAVSSDQSNSTNSLVLAKDPLMRSGVILAGANASWNSEPKINPSNDGVLTALEITDLNLRDTDLVVLSACKTGLGDITGSEGVYGLQRAFKLAGVQYLIMSLWDVPDNETAEFMTLFYKNWIDTQSLRLAFTQTQRQMSKQYSKTPSKWAAFILVE